MYSNKTLELNLFNWPGISNLFLSPEAIVLVRCLLSEWSAAVKSKFLFKRVFAFLEFA